MSLAAILAFLSPIGSALKVLFAPAELSKAFAASVTASSLIGFGVAFLTAIGTDASANPTAGIVGFVVSHVLLTVAGRLAQLEKSSASEATSFHSFGALLDSDGNIRRDNPRDRILVSKFSLPGVTEEAG